MCLIIINLMCIGGKTMKRKWLIMACLGLLASSCENMQPDNTGRNERDRNATKTAGTQAENEHDRAITQKIRQALMEDDTLSTNAKNVKIITIDGIVTLRGPVNNDNEKTSIDKKARGVEGVKNVENLIEVIRVEERK